MTSKEQIIQARENYDKQLDKIQETYKKKLEIINSNSRLTDEGKKQEAIDLWTSTKQEVLEIEQEKSKKSLELLESRRKEAAEQLEALKSSTLSDSKLTDKDLIYLNSMIDRADNDTLKDIAKQYDHDIFALNLINARDSKTPNRDKDGQAIDKLHISHPLEAVAGERLQEDYISRYNGVSDVLGVSPTTPDLWAD